MRYNTLLEQMADERDDGYGVVQIVTPEGTDENQLRFCYYKGGEFVNRPLTITPSAETADRAGEAIDTMASLARTSRRTRSTPSSRNWAKSRSSSCRS